MLREHVMSRTIGCCALVAALAWGAGPRTALAQAAAAPSELAALEAKIEAALDETTSLQFLEQPLGDIATFLEDRHKIEVELDTQALDTAGVTVDTPVTIDVEGITLRSALDLMLRTIELTWCIRGSVLLVTTQEEVESELVTQVYDVRRFLYYTDKQGNRKRSADPLLDVITSHIQPTSWTDVGGTGAIDVLGDTAVVSQTRDVLRETGQLMAALETALKEYQQGAFTAPIDVGVPTTGMTQQIRRALGENTSLQFDEQPLGDVVAALEERHWIEIQLDTTALDTMGVTSDTPVTIEVEGIPLADALQLMLKQIELTFTIRDEVLLITTTEEVESALVTRVYPVVDLLVAEARAAAEGTNVAGDGRPRYGPSIDPLLRVITSTIQPTSWVDVGGTGCISYEPHVRGIVVSQTLDVHGEIESLFAMLRPRAVAPPVRATEPARAQPPEPAVQHANEEQSVRIYGMFATAGSRRPVAEVNALAARIQEGVAPETWRQAGGKSFVQVVDQAIVVRADDRVHQQIALLLSELGIATQPREPQTAGM